MRNFRELPKSTPPVPLDCGIPLDAQYFDDAKFVATPEAGATAVVARIELPAQYCGVLQYFSQFTDALARDPGAVRTPDLRWQLRANGQPLSPYHQLEAILNPWGFGSFQFAIRLPESAIVEMIVRRTNSPAIGAPATVVGGRLLGRYWYNRAFGGTQ